MKRCVKLQTRAVEWGRNLVDKILEVSTSLNRRAGFYSWEIPFFSSNKSFGSRGFDFAQPARGFLFRGNAFFQLQQILWQWNFEKHFAFVARVKEGDFVRVESLTWKFFDEIFYF